MTWNRLAICAIGIALWCHPGFAWGQAAPCPEMDSVTAEARERARALAKKAFQEHEKLQYQLAAELYQEAAELWPRPELYRQAGMAYAQAAELLPAYQHLKRALRCGQGILSSADRTDAEVVLQRLQPWFAELEVQCLQPGLEVLVDGKPWFTCPAEGQVAEGQVVLVGQHIVVAKKAGYIDMNASVVLSASERASVEANLVPRDQAMVATRRWARWKPWAVVGASAVVGAVGGGLLWRSSSRFDDFERDNDEHCVQPQAGCTREFAAELLREQDRALLENRLALGGFAVAGATLITGLTLLYLNRTRPRPNPEAGRARVIVEPMVAGDGGGLSVGLHF